MAYMFTTCLDASKTGLRVIPSEFHKHRHMYGTRQPRYVKESSESRHFEDAPCKREPGQKPFILDVLVDEGRRMRDDLLTRYDRRRLTMSERRDPDLLRPIEDAERTAATADEAGIKLYSSNLKDIHDHVETFHKKWITIIDASKSTSSPRSRSPPDKPKANDPWDMLAREFAKPPVFRCLTLLQPEEIKLIVASCAYRKSHKFAFSAAFYMLCTIKARALGFVPFTTQFAESMTVSGAVARALDHTLAQEGE